MFMLIIVSLLLVPIGTSGFDLRRVRGGCSLQKRRDFKVSASVEHDKAISTKGGLEKKKATTVFSQACLVAGTTIGGGFLALPTATAPLGAVPSTVGLVLTWLYLLGCALSLRDSFYMLSEDDGRSGERGQGLSIFTISKDCFGNVAAIVSSALFLTLVYATLIAQLSKMGTILEGVFQGASAPLCTVAFSILLGAVCLMGSTRNVEKMNDVMTGTMMVSFLSLIGIARTSPSWSTAGLHRADFRPLLPPALATPGDVATPWAVPVFIQLLLYSEVVPLISSRLRDQRKTGLAIVGGSAVPLFMTLTWTYIALALVPFAGSTALTATKGAGAIYDPLARLTGRTILAVVNTLAFSAICTTAVGSVMATINLMEDVCSSLLPGARGRDETIDCDATVPPNIVCESLREADSSIDDDGRGTSDVSGIGGGANVSLPTLARRARRVLLHLVAIGPAAVVAAVGSPDLYFYATAFAGEVPCTLLYGLLPPLCNLRLRWRRRQKGQGRADPAAALLQVALGAISVAVVAGSTLKRGMY